MSRRDRKLLARVLPVAAAVLGSSTLFTSRELVEHPAPGLRLVLRALTPKQVGRLLLRGAGQPIDHYIVEREGTEEGAVLWRISAC